MNYSTLRELINICDRIFRLILSGSKMEVKMRIVFDSGITIECCFPQVIAWIKEKTKGTETLAFEEFFAIVSQTNFQENKEDFLIAVLSCNHILNSYSAVLTKFEEPRLTDAGIETEKAKNVIRKTALDAFICSNQLDLDLLMSAEQPLLMGYTQGSWALYQHNPLIPIMAIIAKHSFHEKTISMAITPYTEEELDDIHTFVTSNYWRIEHLVSKICALISDLSKRPELKEKLDSLDHYTAPDGIRVSTK